MKLERASSKAIKYAIMNWHYSKSVPMVQCAYSVFNDAEEWCGVICYSIGANNRIATPFGLRQGEVIELVRVALNGKQECTSKAIALSLKRVKKDCPLVRLIVSYADSEQGHIGVVYQSTNWYYIGDSYAESLVINGKKTHKKTAHSKYGCNSVNGLAKLGISASYIKDAVKYKYIYPFDREMRYICEGLKKEYPKKNASVA